MVMVKSSEKGGVDGSRTRDRQIAATRALIVSAASALMQRDGYVGTSIAAIAAEAGVAVQTVYNSIGSKRDVLSAVLDREASGPGAPRSVPEMMQQRSETASSADDVIVILADWFCEVHPRILPILQLIRQADAVERGPALEAARATQRRQHYELAAAEITRRPGARPLAAAAMAATIWSLGHPEVYSQLVIEEGWSVADYRAWLLSALRGALLVDTP